MNGQTTKHGSPAPVVLVMCLWGCAGLSAVVGPLYGAARLLAAAAQEKMDAAVLLGSLGCAVAGLGAGCLLWAAAHALRRLDAPPLPREQELPRPAAEEPSPAAGVQAAMPDAERIERLLAELSEINTNLLLSDAERREKRDARRMRLTETIFAEAQQAVKDRDFDRASRAAERLKREFNDTHQSDRIQQLIAKHLAAEQAGQLADQVRRVEELMSLTSFAQARDLARDLSARHPDSAEAQALLERVVRESETFTSEQRKRLYHEVHRAADARQWHTAYTAGQRLLAEYPDSSEADKVASTMPTIQENCRIEEVRQLRDALRDLIQRRRYAEAVKIAHDILGRFPDTQAAAELRPQMEKLEELAQGDHA